MYVYLLFPVSSTKYHLYHSCNKGIYKRTFSDCIIFCSKPQKSLLIKTKFSFPLTRVRFVLTTYEEFLCKKHNFFSFFFFLIFSWKYMKLNLTKMDKVVFAFKLFIYTLQFVYLQVIMYHSFGASEFGLKMELIILFSQGTLEIFATEE